MQELPEKVSEAFYRLKENSSFRIVLQKRNGHYYVYRATTWWDKQEKKVKSSQQYIGRITEYGAFIKRAEEYEKSELDRAIAVLKAHGAVVSFSGEKTVETVGHQYAKQNIGEEISEVDKKILMCLSMNSRMPMSKLAGIVGISEQNAYYRVKAL
ncbi:MAG: AsnC family protein, partial [Candidatus Marsarchaeota archaeon]|nr:AsnC family protein [Candidatus Marsarchaeota archaeon]